MEIKTRKFLSKFTGKLYKDDKLIDVFSCIEEFTDIRFQIISSNESDLYSFTFDFDDSDYKYKQDEFGKWNKEFPEYENPILKINIDIRSFQIDGEIEYKKYY